MFQCSLTISSLLLLLNLSTFVCIAMFYDVLLSYLQYGKMRENVSFPQLPLYIGVQVMYLCVYVGVYVQVCM